MLAFLYYVSNGDQWFAKDGWISYTTHECDWYYYSNEPTMKNQPSCNEDGDIVRIGLTSNNLRGDFPAWPHLLSQLFLSKLRAFDVSHNELSGVTPVISGSGQMETSILSNNTFYSPPSGGGGSAWLNFRIIKFDSNNYSGSWWHCCYPLLPNIEFYNITGNQFVGQIPGTMGLFCRDLSWVGMASNLLTGSIPTEFGLLTAMTHLDLSGNAEMNGTIPSELESLTQLTHLDLRGTMITGDLPLSFCDSGNVDDVDIGVGNGTTAIAVASASANRTRVKVLANCSLVNCCS